MYRFEIPEIIRNPQRIFTLPEQTQSSISVIFNEGNFNITTTSSPSPRQIQRYSYMMHYIELKNDLKNYPKISPQDFSKIYELCVRPKWNDNIMYKKMAEGVLQADFVKQFVLLLINQRNEQDIYPKSNYIVIPELSNMKNEDTIKKYDNKNNLIIIFKKNRWNVLVFSPKNKKIFLYLLDAENKFREGEIENLINEFNNAIFPEVPMSRFNFDYSLFNNDAAAIYPLFIMDNFSRGLENIPDLIAHDIDYYRILYIHQLMKNTLFTK